MDFAWITPYGLLAGTVWLVPGRGLLRPISILLLLAGAQIVGRRTVEAADTRRGRLRLVVLGVLASAALIAWQYGPGAWSVAEGSWWRAAMSLVALSRPEAPAWVMGLLVWRRGLVLGRTSLESHDVDAAFHLGLGAFCAFAAITAAGRTVPVLSTTAAAAFPYLLLYFAAALFALPLAALESVQRRTRAPRRNTAVTGDWYWVLAAAVAVLLASAMVAGGLLRLDVGGLARALAPLLNAVLLVFLYGVALPIAWVLSGMIWLLQRWLHLGGRPLSPQPSPPNWIMQLPSHAATGLSPNAALAARGGLAVLLLALAIWWLARAVSRHGRTGRRVSADVQRESVWSWDDVRASWWAFLRRGLASPTASDLDYGGGGAGAIRRCYAEFLAVAAALVRSRRIDETPMAFARAIGDHRPDVAQSVDTVTAAYVRVRYGLAIPSPDEVTSARTALERLRSERATALDAQVRGVRPPVARKGRRRAR